MVKKKKTDFTKISIITVVFNGEKNIEETIKSITNQTYKHFEYIIIDGGSTDNTLEIIKKYNFKIDYWVSEPDRGIYDAMNKGIDVATGQWINFMNAGDVFYENSTLEEIFITNDYKNIDVIYGNHNVIYPQKTKIAKVGDIKNLWKGSQFCHQSSFVASKTQKANKFNHSNKISADFELFYSLYKKNKVFRYVDIIIVNYSAGGVSDVKRIDSIVGWWNVIDKNNKRNLHYCWMILKEILKGYVKGIVHNK